MADFFLTVVLVYVSDRGGVAPRRQLESQAHPPSSVGAGGTAEDGASRRES